MAQCLIIIVAVKVDLLQEILVDFYIAHLQITWPIVILPSWQLLVLLSMVESPMLLRGNLRLILQGWILLDLGRANLTLFFISDDFGLIF